MPIPLYSLGTPTDSPILGPSVNSLLYKPFSGPSPSHTSHTIWITLWISREQGLWPILRGLLSSIRNSCLPEHKTEQAKVIRKYMKQISAIACFWLFLRPAQPSLISLNSDESVTSLFNIQFHLILNVNPFTPAKQGEVHFTVSVSSHIMQSTVSLKMSPWRGWDHSTSGFFPFSLCTQEQE